MTKLISIAVLSIGLASLSLAQGAGPTGGKLSPPKQTRGGGARRPLIEALGKLNLTLEQKTKIQTLAKAREEDTKAFRKEHKGDKAANKAHMEEATKTFLAGIKGILTPAQWDQFQAELRAMRGKGRGKRGGANPPAAKP